MEHIEKFIKKGVEVRALDVGTLSTIRIKELTTFLYFYAGKNELITRQERVKEGIRKAKENNKYKGRKTVITKKKCQQVQKHLNKNNSVRDIAKICVSLFNL